MFTTRTLRGYLAVYLCPCDGKVSHPGVTLPLHCVELLIQARYITVTRYLTQAGASLSLPDHEGATALDGARMSATAACEACVSMMVEAGASDAHGDARMPSPQIS